MRISCCPPFPRLPQVLKLIMKDWNFLVGLILVPSLISRLTSPVTGDSFLKYLASVYVFVTNPAQHEGALHTTRQRIISNKVLMQNADRIGLPQYVQSRPFSHKLWYPPNFTVDPLSLSTMADPAGSGDEIDVTADILQGKQDSVSQDEDKNASNVFKKKKKKKLRDENVIQWLGDKVSEEHPDRKKVVLTISLTKTIADVTEAIIGAAYLSGGQDSALQAAKALQVPIPLIHHWQDFRRMALAVPSTCGRPLRQGTTEAVEAIIGHRFRLPHLLVQALVNGLTLEVSRTYANTKIPDSRVGRRLRRHLL